MHFFERQEVARKNTTYLIFLFVVAVIGILVSTCAVAVFIAHTIGADPEMYGRPFSIWDHLSVLGITAMGTLLVIFLGALYKWQLLGNSGMAVAEYMGGRLVNQQSKDLHERKLINVVEEMAIASGIPVPLIYIMNSEHSVNAFAAGTTTHDAVVAVTRGTIENLSRDELQGVIAHEFSHIFNGDCKLNMRLIGFLAGIVTIGLIGRYLVETVPRSRRSKDEGQALAFILVAGIALMVIGYLGVFIGRLIRAAISRQREYLADASAVQYTRYPAGIAGALAKIQHLSSYVMNGHAEETSHMFFDAPINPFIFFGGALATHPPLDKRIAAIDKRFLDKDFLERSLKYPQETSAPKLHEKYRPQAKDVLKNMGTVGAQNLSQAGLLIAGLSPLVTDNHADPTAAQALVLGLLMRESHHQETQLELIETLVGKSVAAQIAKLSPEIAKSMPEQHLPIFELCAPALRTLEPNQQQRLLKAAEYIVRVDSQIDLLEASYLLLLTQTLKANQKRKNLSPVNFAGAFDSIKIVIASLAHHGHSDLHAAQKAFSRAIEVIGGSKSQIPPPSFCDGRALIKAIDVVSRCQPRTKQLVIEGCVSCVEHDGHITAEEFELLRAVAASLDAPIPLTTKKD